MSHYIIALTEIKAELDLVLYWGIDGNIAPCSSILPGQVTVLDVNSLSEG